MCEPRRWLCLIVLSLAGCAAGGRDSDGPPILFVPGVAGDGPWYDGLKRGLREGGVNQSIESFRWGAPMPLFAMNFNSKSIHNSAEEQLASRIVALAREHPEASIQIIAHSAGGGVALGATGRLPEGVRVRRVVLLHPSISPGYDLNPALRRVDEIVLFHSGQDTTFLKWRTSTFGTYDGIKTAAAGNAGFDLSSLPNDRAARVKQLAYVPEYQAQGNRGDHFGPTARRFASDIIAPILVQQLEATGKAAARP